jgi:hypothetical protein
MDGLKQDSRQPEEPSKPGVRTPVRFTDRDVAALNSCISWLQARKGTPVADRLGWSHMMGSYANSLDGIVSKIEQQGFDAHPVTMDEIFGK